MGQDFFVFLFFNLKSFHISVIVVVVAAVVLTAAAASAAATAAAAAVTWSFTPSQPLRLYQGDHISNIRLVLQLSC